MPPPRMYGPTITETFDRPGQQKRIAKEMRQVAAGEDMATNRLYFLRRDLREIERRAKKNKRGLSPKMAERRKAIQENIDRLERGQANAQRILEQTQARRDRQKAKRRAESAANAANKPKKAASKAKKSGSSAAKKAK